MIARRSAIIPVAIVLATLMPSIALGQRAANNDGVAGYATFGRINFSADKSFDAILGDSRGAIIGGGVRVDLRIAGWFFDVGTWRFQRTGERAFIFRDEVIPLGVPVEVTAMPIEITGGWRFHLRRWPAVIPYLAGGLTSMRYREESAFSTRRENDDQTFNGLLARAGAEVKILRWVGVGGEAAWSSLPDALGDGGVSQAFNEDNLGGASLRFTIIVGK